MIIYDKLFSLLAQRNINAGSLVRLSLISRGTLNRLKNNESVNLFTLDLLSAYLDCEIWDIFTYIPIDSD